MARKTPEERIQTLRRRRDYLQELVDVDLRGVNSYDRAELAALQWGIRILERAVALGLLADLERAA